MTNLTHGGRGTGRTTRMLEKALDLARKGQIVYVLVSGHDHHSHMKQALTQLAVNKGLLWAADQNVRITRVADPSVVEPQPGKYQVRFGPPDHTVLVDHWVYELLYEGVVYGWLEAQHGNP